MALKMATRVTAAIPETARAAPRRSKLGVWPQLLVWAWVALSLIAVLVRGQQNELDQHVSNRLRFHAIPVAMSVLYHGRPHDYTAFSSLAMFFQNDDPLESKIAKAVTESPPLQDATYYWAADDRGMGDFVIGAFALFGPHVRSLYLFYFVLLGTSLVLFLLDLGWHPVMSATILFVVAALYACLSVIPLANLTDAVFEPGSLYEPRVIELLSYAATLHLAVAAFVDDRWTARRIVIVAAQAALLVACYHARSSIGWQVLFVLAANGVFWARRPGSGHRRDGASSARGGSGFSLPWPGVCVIAGFLLLAAYKRHAYNPRYFQDMGSRTIWHNALMGLGSDRQLKEHYKLGINDAAVVTAVVNYLRETHDPRLTPEWTHVNILGALGGHAVFNWFVFEDAARDLYWHIWRVETRSMLHCYLIDKPRDIMNVVLQAMRTDPSGVRHLPGLHFNPLAALSLLIAAPGLILAYVRRAAFGPLLAAVFVLLACSMTPGFLFYPVVHTMMGVFMSIALALYLALSMLLSAAGRFGEPPLDTF